MYIVVLVKWITVILLDVYRIWRIEKTMVTIATTFLAANLTEDQQNQASMQWGSTIINALFDGTDCKNEKFF